MLSDIVVSTSNVGANTKKFNGSTTCVTSLVLREMKYLDFSGFKKIILNAVKEKKYDDPIVMCDVLQNDCLFDVDNFLLLCKNKKKYEIFKLIKNEILALASIYDWDIHKLKVFFNSIEKKIYNNVVPIGKELVSPDKIFKAQLIYVHDIDSIKLNVNLENMVSKEVKSEEVVTVDPHEWNIVPYLGKLQWKSNNDLYLNSKSKGVIKIGI